MHGSSASERGVGQAQQAYQIPRVLFAKIRCALLWEAARRRGVLNPTWEGLSGKITLYAIPVSQNSLNLQYGRKNRLLLLAAFLYVCIAISPASGTVLNTVDFGATPGDATDDTAAVNKALSACNQTGDGTVYVTAGEFLISREGSLSPILTLPSHSSLCGEGAASILRFPERASASNF